MENVPHILSYYDVLLAPIYFFILLLVVLYWKNKYYSQSPLKKYLLPAFFLKITCCLLLSFLYEFYYGYSDAHNYFTGVTSIWNAAKINPAYAVEIIFKPIDKWSLAAEHIGEYMTNPLFSSNIIYMYKIAGFIGLFCFGTYLPIAFIITLLSFIGSWKIFLVFVEEFPTHYKKIALTCLFAPSFIFWSTNIMKDPLCIFGLGLCFSGFYSILKKRVTFIIILQMILGVFIMLMLKSYIFYIFLVAAVFGAYLYIMERFKSVGKAFLRIGVFILASIIAGLVFSQRAYLLEAFSKGFMGEIFSIQNVQKDTGGSTYTLSNVEDASFLGIIKTYTSSLNVTLFRPYLWEVPNIIAIANALESFIILFFTIYLLVKLKFIGFFNFAFNNWILGFALIFTLLLAPLAGLVSFNFGTLVRYKAPLVPFYYTYLVLLYTNQKNHRLKNTLVKPANQYKAA